MLPCWFLFFNCKYRYIHTFVNYCQPILIVLKVYKAITTAFVEIRLNKSTSMDRYLFPYTLVSRIASRPRVLCPEHSYSAVNFTFRFIDSSPASFVLRSRCVLHNKPYGCVTGAPFKELTCTLLFCFCTFAGTYIIIATTIEQSRTFIAFCNSWLHLPLFNLIRTKPESKRSSLFPHFSSIWTLVRKSRSDCV